MKMVYPCLDLAGVEHTPYLLATVLVFHSQLRPIDIFALACSLINLEEMSQGGIIRCG